MKIGIIGAGFTGLSAALELQKKGYDITVFEKEEIPGGLAAGFNPLDSRKKTVWTWSLEKHYHHFFTNDKEALNIAKEINNEIIIKKPKTSVFIENQIIQLDSPLKVLTFSRLKLIERLRMAAILALLRYNPIWKPLEKINAVNFLPKTMGKKPYQMIWQPQLIGKFGEFANEISLAWFWARIKKRTTKLAYPKGGFLDFENKLVDKVTKNQGKILLNSEVTSIKNNTDKIQLTVKNTKDKKTKIYSFDKVIITLPSSIFLKIAPGLPKDYKDKFKNIKNIAAINLVLRLNKPFFKDNTYWLSICEKNWPFTAIVEHTNFMDKKLYNNENLIYIGKYLSTNHPHFSKSKEELLKIYDPYLKKINKNYKNNIIDYYLFKDPFAQPIIPINYSKIIPPFETPLKNIYLSNIEQVYPWDRGTNYAIELGQNVAKLI